MLWARRILGGLLFVGALYVGLRFPAKNATPISVDYLAGQTPELALWLVLLGAFAAGALLTGLPILYLMAKNRLVAHRYRRAMGGLEAEIHQLRNLPLSPNAPSEPREAPVSDPPAPGAAGASS